MCGTCWPMSASRPLTMRDPDRTTSSLRRTAADPTIRCRAQSGAARTGRAGPFVDLSSHRQGAGAFTGSTSLARDPPVALLSMKQSCAHALLVEKTTPKTTAPETENPMRAMLHLDLGEPEGHPQTRQARGRRIHRGRCGVGF